MTDQPKCPECEAEGHDACTNPNLHLPSPADETAAKCEGCEREFDKAELMPPNRNGHVLCEPCFHNDHNAGLDMLASDAALMGLAYW